MDNHACMMSMNEKIDLRNECAYKLAIRIGKATQHAPATGDAM